jgi:hypothetical protein
MMNASGSERLRHATNKIEKIRNGHQMIRPQAGAS